MRATAPFVAQFRGTVQILDMLVVGAAVLITLAAGFGAGGPIEHDPSRRFLALLLLVIWPVMLWQRQVLATTILGAGLEEYRRVAVASTWTVIAAAAMAYGFDIERGRWFLAAGGLIGTSMLLLERLLMRRVLHRLMAGGRPLHRVFVIASADQEQQLTDGLGAGLRRTDIRFQVVGSWPLRGTGSDPDPRVIIERAVSVQADTIVYAPLGTADSTWTRRLGWAMEDFDLSLLVSPSLIEIAGPRLKVEPVAGLALVRVDMPRFSGPARVVKRGLDIVGSLIGLTLLGIPMLIIAMLIRRDSPGPAIFRQIRAGARSSTFECWKYRTMYNGADAQRDALRDALVAGQAASATTAATFKMAEDPRITPIGGFLRRYSIDELPQLVNVLRGEMSLVGPRPHPLDDVSRYDDDAHRRLLAKPGMTGLWQVSGRSDLDWDQAVRLDLYYVENWSLTGDLLILLRTIKVVLSGSGAY